MVKGNFLLLFSLLSFTFSLQSQNGIFIEYGGYLYIEDRDGTEPTLYIEGELINEPGGLIESDSGEIEITGDWINNGTFSSVDGMEKFSGTGEQTIDGNMSDENDFFHLRVNKSPYSLLVLNTDAEIDPEGNLGFMSGGIIQTGSNQVYVKNPDLTSISGYDPPNITGYYSDDRYVYGKLKRRIGSNSTYEFPIGDSWSLDITKGERYNPVVLVYSSGASDTATTSAVFVQGDAGSNNYNNNVLCLPAGTLKTVKYTNMTSEGKWRLNSDENTEFSYNIYLHPNQLNLNIAPTWNDEYRALRAPEGTTNWTSFSTAGDPCIVSPFYYYIIGVGYTGFSGTSDFAPGGGGNSMPGNFGSLPTKKNPILQYIPSGEYLGQGVDLLRSTNGVDFEKITSLEYPDAFDSVSGVAFEDQNVTAGIQYFYQVREYSDEQNYIESEVLTARMPSDNEAFVGELFPNPAMEMVYVNVEMPQSGLLELVISDLPGRMIQTKQFNLNSGLNRLQFDPALLSEGTYLLNFYINKKRHIRKLMVIR